VFWPRSPSVTPHRRYSPHTRSILGAPFTASLTKSRIILGSVSRRKKKQSLKGTVWAVRVNVLMAASMKITAFWNVTPCSLVEVGRRFRRTYCLYHQGLIMKVVHTSETSVYYSAGICSIHDISNLVFRSRGGHIRVVHSQRGSITTGWRN
jgi:hypothetical protein